jgi:hypothetical protein
VPKDCHPDQSLRQLDVAAKKIIASKRKETAAAASSVDDGNQRKAIIYEDARYVHESARSFVTAKHLNPVPASYSFKSRDQGPKGNHAEKFCGVLFWFRRVCRYGRYLLRDGPHLCGDAIALDFARQIGGLQ